MKLFVLLILSFSFEASAKLRDLSVNGVTKGLCGTLAAAMTERVYSTNNSTKKQYYEIPVFDKNLDFEMRRYLQLLATESEKFTKDTPDSKRLNTMVTAYEILKKKNHPFVRDCVRIYHPLAEKCFSKYQAGSKEESDQCIRDGVDKKVEEAFIKTYFLRAM